MTTTRNPLVELMASNGAKHFIAVLDDLRDYYAMQAAGKGLSADDRAHGSGELAAILALKLDAEEAAKTINRE